MPLPLKPEVQWQEKREKVTVPTQTSRHSLTEISQEYHFFNHGALFAFTELSQQTDDPVGEWYIRQPPGTVVLREIFKRPIFNGLFVPIEGTRFTWDHCICGVRHESWPTLFEFLGGIATLDMEGRTYSQLFSGDLQILDPVLVERHGILHPGITTVPVTVFCVDGYQARWEVRPGLTAIDPPRFVRSEPRPEVRQLAEAVFEGDLARLTSKDNPAFQPLLDKYKQLMENRNAHKL